MLQIRLKITSRPMISLAKTAEICRILLQVIAVVIEDSENIWKDPVKSG